MTGKNCTLISVVIVLLCTHLAFSQESENINLYSEHFWAWEYPTGIAYFEDETNNKYLALSTGTTGLGLLSVNEPLYPELISNYETDVYAYQVEAIWPYVILAEADCIRLINISNPQHPEDFREIDLEGTITELAVINDSLFYASGGSESLYIIDISESGFPMIINTIAITDSCTDLLVNNDKLTVCGMDRTVLYDISDPINPFELYVFNGSSKAALSEDKLAFYSEGTFRIYNIESPGSPVLMYEDQQDWIPYGWYGDELHVAKEDTLIVNRVGNDGSVQRIFWDRVSQEINVDDHALEIVDYEMKSLTGYALCWRSLDAVEITIAMTEIKPYVLSDPNIPGIGQFYNNIEKKFCSIRYGNYIYVSSSVTHLRILEIIDDNQIVEHEPYIMPESWYSYTIDLGVLNDKLIMSYCYWVMWSDLMGFVIELNISDPLQPSTDPYDPLFLQDHTNMINVDDVDNYIYVIPEPVGFQPYDEVKFRLRFPDDHLSFDWTYAWEDGSYRSGTDIDFSIDDSLAYVSFNPKSNETNGFYVLDINDTSPWENYVSTTIEVPGFASGIKADRTRNILYLCNGYEGVYLYSLENDPEYPEYYGVISTGGKAKYIQLVNNFVFVVNEDIGLEIYDVSDIQNPELSGWFYDVGVFRHVEVVDSVAQLTSDRHFYLLDCINAMGGTSGIKNKQVDTIPQEHIIYPPYPNPFNSSAQVKVELDSPSRVTIKAYDILGRELYRETKFLKQGNHTVPLDLKGLTTSGPILVRVQTEKSGQVYKLYRLE